MKTFINLLIATLLGGFSLAQGINSEVGLNFGYEQKAKSIVAMGNHTFISHSQTIATTWINPDLIRKLDSTGLTLWSVSASPIFTEKSDVYQMIPSHDETQILISGHAMPTCDVVEIFGFVFAIEPNNGTFLWSKIFPYVFGNTSDITGLSATEHNEYWFNYSNPNTSILFKMNPSGVVLDSLTFSVPAMQGFAQSPNSNLIGFKNDTLYSISATGSINSTLKLGSPIKELISHNDMLFALGNGTLYALNNQMVLVNQSPLGPFGNFSQLKTKGNNLILLDKTGGTIHQVECNTIPILLSAKVVNTNLANIELMDHSQGQLRIANEHQLTDKESIRMLNYSWNQANNQTINRSEVDLLVTEVQNSYASLISSPNVYTLHIQPKVLLKNNGPNAVNSCRFTAEVSGFGICGPNIYHTIVSGLNLLPNDSIWIVLDQINYYPDYYPNGPLTKQICVFASNPNEIVDLVVSNDMSCKTVNFGMVGTDELSPDQISIFPNPTQNQIKIEGLSVDKHIFILRNQLGQEVKRVLTPMHSMELQEFSIGLYYLEIQTEYGESIVTKKIVLH